MLLNILDMPDSPQQIMIPPKMSTVLSNCVKTGRVMSPGPLYC